ncbi:FAD-binding oxidoreductase [Chitinivorax sp. B]|uniref:FAD-binding oxidoreductase n=1 Tax=Chitinivorax sp. B TaxID=2502235 RepID=UPI0010F94650|nr:FAD-binding oxidoreductase [Chitinivorax sp. B]
METIHLLEALQRLLGNTRMLTDTTSMAPFCLDQRRRYHGLALAVLHPVTVTEVQQIVRLAASAGVCIVPQGGNTGLVGGATPLPNGRHSLILNLARLNTVRGWQDDTITVESGIVLDQLNGLTAARGLQLPIDLASSGSAQLGGLIATNAGGMRVIRHGMMRQQVLGLEVVLANGEIWSDLRPLLKNNSGYDLKQLFIGAEGTLGVVTAATLKLAPIPKQVATAWIALPNVAKGMALLTQLKLQAGDALTAFELISRTCIELVARHVTDLSRPLAEDAPWYALVELATTHDRINLDTLLADCLQQQGLLDAALAQNQAQTVQLWRWRELIPEAQRLAGGNIKHDIAVPCGAIPAFVTEAEQRLQERFPTVEIIAFGHAGDGNLHYNVAHTRSTPVETFLDETEVNEIVYALVQKAGGTFSAEHGIGQLKRDRLADCGDPTGIQLMRGMKAWLDPTGLFNPGKVI